VGVGGGGVGGGWGGGGGPLYRSELKKNYYSFQKLKGKRANRRKRLLGGLSGKSLSVEIQEHNASEIFNKSLLHSGGNVNPKRLLKLGEKVFEAKER